jgi:hypothetical protein
MVVQAHSGTAVAEAAPGGGLRITLGLPRNAHDGT